MTPTNLSTGNRDTTIGTSLDTTGRAGDVDLVEAPPGVDSLRWNLSSPEERLELLDTGVGIEGGSPVTLSSSAGGDADVVDIYIGGGGEGISNYPIAERAVGSAVWDRVESLKANNPDDSGQTIAYYHWSQEGEALERANNALASGKTVNLIGHSYGATTALTVANKIDPENGKINLLVGVDPVRNPRPHLPGSLDYPADTVDRVVVIDDTVSESDDPTTSDNVERLGDTIARNGIPVPGPLPNIPLLPLTGYAHPDVIQHETEFGHQDFESMLDDPIEDADGNLGPSIGELLARPSARSDVDDGGAFA